MYHLTEDGPKVCKARVRVCPIGGDHFESIIQAPAEFAKNGENITLPTLESKNARLYGAYRHILSATIGGMAPEKRQRALKMAADRYEVPMGELKDIVRVGDKNVGIIHERNESWGFDEGIELLSMEVSYLDSNWEETGNGLCPVCGKPDNSENLEIKKDVAARILRKDGEQFKSAFLSCFRCSLKARGLQLKSE